MARGFIGSIELGRAANTFTGTIVEIDGELLGNFTGLAISTEAGEPITDINQIGPSSFVIYKTEGNVEGAAVREITRIAMVSIPPKTTEDVVKQVRQAARALAKGGDPMLTKVVIIKG